MKKVHNAISAGRSRSALVWVCLCALVAAIAPVLALPATRSAAAGSFTVTSTADTPDAAPGDGVCADGDGACTLRAAVMEANALAGADVIYLNAGTVQLTLTGNDEDDAATGDLDLKGQLSIVGAGAELTVIEASEVFTDRIFDILSNAQVSIEGVTVRNARILQEGGGLLNRSVLTLTGSMVTQNIADGGGGGISNAGTLTLLTSTISFNEAGFGGGGIANSVGGVATLIGSRIEGNSSAVAGGLLVNGRMSVTGSRIEGNSSATLGGGIEVCCGGSLSLLETVVSGNTAFRGAGILGAGVVTLVNSELMSNSASGQGGAIYGTAAMTVTGSIFSNNSALDGGALFQPASATGVITIRTSNFDSNRAERRGGALYGAGGQLQLSHSTVSGNHAGLDGGAWLISGTATALVTNSTLSGNSAEDDGGGIYMAGGELNAYHATIALNRASDNDLTGSGGGIRRAGGSVNLYNTLLAYNSRNNGAVNDDCSGTLNLLRYSLLSNAAGCTFSDDQSITNTNPLLNPLADNSGPTLTHLPLAGSPVIDAAATSECAATDQRGFARPQGDGCDIGAVEVLRALYLPLIRR